MARDVFHQQVKNALIKDGWTITNDPLTIRISEAVKVQIDLAAENAIAAERDSEKKDLREARNIFKMVEFYSLIITCGSAR